MAAPRAVSDFKRRCPFPVCLFPDFIPIHMRNARVLMALLIVFLNDEAFFLTSTQLVLMGLRIQSPDLIF